MRPTTGDDKKRVVRFVHFFGADGVGKTTQAQMLVDQLRQKGVRSKLIRLRSGRTLAFILYLLYKRYGSSRVQLGGDGRVLRVYTIRSRFDRHMWSLIEFSSMLPLIFQKVLYPLARGNIVVAERYMIDAIATISYFVNDPSWPNSFMARLLIRFIPPNSILIRLDAPFETIAKRKGKGVDPREYIEFQRRTYSAFAKVMNALTIDTSSKRPSETNALVCGYLGCN